tara:strand:- start:505 stop:702 length:198 start_codon:yes stop_codon:yes gene_type:complete
VLFLKSLIHSKILVVQNYQIYFDKWFMNLFLDYQCLVGYILIEAFVVLAVIVILAGITFGTTAGI